MYNVSPLLVNSVLPQIVQTVAEELYRLMSCVRKFSLAGIQQARADIGALQEIFAIYSNEKALLYFKEALEVTPQCLQAEMT